MSLKMNSLAFDESVQLHSRSAVLDFEPELSVVKPRHLSRSHGFSTANNSEEVVEIGGKFTISF